MTVVVERIRTSGVGNAQGIAWVDLPGYTDAVSAGGWATLASAAGDPPFNPCTGCSQIEDDPSAAPGAMRGLALGCLPMVGVSPQYDSATGTTYFSVGFAAPPNVWVCAHCYIARVT